MSGYLKVTKEVFDAYPGRKSSAGSGSEMTYGVAQGESRPLTEQARELADRLNALLDELGFSNKLAAGGIPASLVIETLASAVVAVVDENVPQYARKSVLSLAREVDRSAKSSHDWSAGAGVVHGSLRELRGDPDAPVVPSI